jgi:hypothetical protein
MNSPDPWRVIVTDPFGGILLPRPQWGGHPFYREVPSWTPAASGESRALFDGAFVSGWADNPGDNMNDILGAELTALSAPGFGFFRPWYRPYYGVVVGGEAEDFQQAYAEFSRFWRDVQENVNAAQGRITSDPEYKAYHDAWRAEEARHRSLTSYDDRVRSVARQRELADKVHSIYQGRKGAFPVLVWETNVYEPVRMELLSLSGRINARLQGASATHGAVQELSTSALIHAFRELLAALEKSAPFAPYPNAGFIRPGVKREVVGAEQRTGLMKDLAPIVAPATGGVLVEKHLDDKQVLHVKICVDGKCYSTSMNLAPAIAMVMQKLARWHDGMHAPKPAPPTVVSTVENAIGAAGDAMAEALVGRHIAVMAGSWLSDIGGAIGGTLRKLQPLISTVATGVATAYGGPAAGAAAAKLSPMITNLDW